MVQDLALIKLGGSVVTFKDRPLAANARAIDGISRALARLGRPFILVHGGGSFGHYWSVKYDMHTRPDSYDAHGVSVVHESMMALNQVIVNSMMREGLNPYAVQPHVFTTGHAPIPAKIRQLLVMATKSRLVPVTFGDVVHVEGRKYSILSGDALMSILARALRPSRVIFATNVDGIYRDMESKELLPEIMGAPADKKKKRRRGPTAGTEEGQVEFSGPTAGIADVTGGMQRKVTEAFKIASLGIDVLMVNGLVPDRIVQAAADGRPEVGTVISGRKGRRSSPLSSSSAAARSKSSA